MSAAGTQGNPWPHKKKHLPPQFLQLTGDWTPEGQTQPALLKKGCAPPTQACMPVCMVAVDVADDGAAAKKI